MAKLVLNDVTNLTNEPSVLNTINVNSALIEEAFDNTLSRDGTEPNEMLASLDMNNHRILNIPPPVNPGDPVRLADVIAGSVDLDLGSLLAVDIGYTPQGSISSTNVQDAIQEVVAEIPALPSLPLSIANGGTASATAANARTALGLAIGTNVQAFNSNYITSNTTTNLTVGYTTTSFSLGTLSSGTTTLNAANGQKQHATNNGAHTLAPPSSVCSMVVEYTNGASAGAVTTSGFTKVVGDTMLTTNGLKYALGVEKTQNYSLLTIIALQ